MQTVNQTSISRRRTHIPLTLLSTALIGAFALSACGDSDGDSDDGTGGTGASNGTGGSDGTGASQGTGASNMGGATGGVDSMGGQGGMGGGPAVDDLCDPDDGGIELAEGFCAVLSADNLGKARHVTVSPSGDVFVAVNPTPGGAPGKIVALRDTDADGKLDMRATFNTTGGNGIVWRKGELFFAENDRIIKYAMPDGQLEPTLDPVVIVSGLPDDGDHVSKSIAFADDETMYVNIGSATNSCQVNNRQLESPGSDPCAELDTRAGIWAFDPTVENQTAADGVRFASGTRNMNALAIQPGTGDLWGAQNGRDQLAENWPAFFDTDDDSVLPSEELLRIVEDETYGWPFCYHDPALGMVLAPEYGGDGQTTGPCSEYPLPDFSFPAHWAPLGAAFYNGTHFPEEYQGGMFVAFHGSRFEPNATGDLPGYQVGFLPFDEDVPGEDFTTFASGFAGDERPLPGEAESRPVGVTVAADGSLYISDDYGGKLWRVFYIGE